MTHTTRTIGVCPDCESALARADVLVEYETAAGEVGCYADCVDCDDVVRPVEPA
mgnify:CR=1 FL=1